MSAALLDGWTETRTGAIIWLVAPGFKRALFGTSGRELNELLARSRADVVKQNPRRQVFRVALPDGQILYIKHHYVLGLRDRLRHFFRPNKARTECLKALALAARGVSTIEPVAIGERQSWFGAKDSFLVTSSLDDTQPLNEFLAGSFSALPADRQTAVRHELARALGKLVARLHDAGIRHEDLHAANILIELTGDYKPLLYLVDLEGVRLGAPLQWPASRDNLVLLARWFIPRCSWTDRMRFWRAYFEGRGFGVWPCGCQCQKEHFALAREVEEEAIRSNLAFWKKRDRRCLSNNRYFHRVRRGDIVGHVVNDLDPATLNKLLSDPDAPFRQRGVSLLKDSRSSTVADLKYTIDGVQRRLIYKRFRVRTLLESLASVLRPTHATKSWKLGHELCTRCLSTARPLLVLHRTRRGFQRDGYLLTERVENALDLHQFVGSLGQLGSDAARHRLRLGLSAVARAIRQLHGCQMSHRDLKATNLFLENDLKDKSAPLRQVQPAPSGAALPSYLPLPASPVWFIDLAGARLHSRLSRKRRVKDLARLNTSFHQSPALTRTDKLRFLRSYLLWNLVGRGDWKNWWKAIAQATARKVDRNIRRGRVLT